MACEEHLEIIKQGPLAWNQWRKANPDVHPDLSNAHLTAANLNVAGMVGIDLSSTDLSGATLVSADLKQANITYASLSGALCAFTKLSKANLANSFLNGARFISASLDDADLSKANLTAADLQYADLSGANLSDAILNNANLNRAILNRTNLTNADFSSTLFGWTTIVDADLSSARGLGSIVHRGPSSIGVDTLYKSGRKLPEDFLRGCGIPDEFITYLPSLLGARQSVEFYSCFISYSHSDEEFAQRLCSRMKDERIRVWFAPEDIQGGKKIHEQIESAIQFHDKLLVVLSENSLQSQWVMTEIRNARRTEIDQKRRKLFPLLLVDFETVRRWKCFDSESGKDLAIEVREYFIPDFLNWKDHDTFELAFKRLLRDLKADDQDGNSV